MNKNMIQWLRHPGVAAALAILLCAIHYFASTNVYETTARVELSPEAFDKVAQPMLPADVIDIAYERLDVERAKAGLELLDVNAFAEDVIVDVKNEEHALELRYHSPDREIAEAILNALAAGYVENSRELKTSTVLPKLERLEFERQIAGQNARDSQQRISELEQEIADAQLNDSDEQATRERIKAFSKQLADVKTSRLEAEARYRQTSEELNAGSTVNLIAAQFTDESSKEIVQAVLSHAELQEALREVKKAKQDLSRYYGARHPRMLELAAKEVELTRQIHETNEPDSVIQQAGAIEETPENDRRALLLKSLAFDLRRRHALEEELQDHLEIEQARLNHQALLAEQLETAKEQVQSAQQNITAIDEEMTATKQRHQSRAEIAVLAATGESPISPSFWWHAIIGGLAVGAAAWLYRWAMRELPKPATAGPENEESDSPQQQKPLYARRLMRLARIQTVSSESE